MTSSIQSRVTINSLGDLCLEHIFLYIPIMERIQLRKVCKKWRNVVDNCWRKIRSLELCGDDEDNPEVFDEGENITVFFENPKLANGFVKLCAPYLTSLRYSCQCSRIFPIACRKCRNLKRLDVWIHSKKIDQQVAQLLRANKHITCVCLWITEECYKCVNAISANILEQFCILQGNDGKSEPGLVAAVKKIISSAHSLKNFKCDVVDGGLLEKLGEIRTLESVILAEMRSSAIGENGLNNILKMKNLKELYLDLYVDTPNGAITDQFVRDLSNNCQMLEEITLAGHLRITNDGMLDLLKLPHLILLCISKAPSITDAPLKYFTKLTHLTVRVCMNVRDSGVIRLLRKSQVIEYLDLEGTNIGTQTVIAANKAVKKRTNNTSLRLVTPHGINDRGLKDKSPLLKLWESCCIYTEHSSGSYGLL